MKPKRRLRVDEMDVETNSLVGQGAAKASNGPLVLQNAEDPILAICQAAATIINEAEEEHEKHEAITQLMADLRNEISPTVTQEEAEGAEYRAQLTHWANWQGFTEYVNSTVTDLESGQEAVLQLAAMLYESGVAQEDVEEAAADDPEEEEEEARAETEKKVPLKKGKAKKAVTQDDPAKPTARGESLDEVDDTVDAGGSDPETNPQFEQVAQSAEDEEEELPQATYVAERPAARFREEVGSDGHSVVQTIVRSPEQYMRDGLFQDVFSLEGALVRQDDGTSYRITRDMLEQERAEQATQEPVAQGEGEDLLSVIQSMREEIASLRHENAEARVRKAKPRSRQPEGDPSSVVRQSAPSKGDIWRDSPLGSLMQ